MIRNAVLVAAGLGTRLLPATKEQPKEMLPVYVQSARGGLCLKPLLQLIFEQLYDLGLREFCMVIGRGKRAIEDHFTEDYAFASYLRKTSHRSAAEELEAFYRRLDDSVVLWVTQPEPKGFGNAVLRARNAVGDSNFLVHAGDAYIISRGNAHFKRLVRVFDQKQSIAVFLIHELPNPRQKGIAEVRQQGADSYEVLSVVEKPKRPKTNLGIEPVYIFRPTFFEALEKTKPGKGGEVQLTDAIQRTIGEGRKVHATKLLEDEERLDVGDPRSYWKALALSYRLANG
jgi:UTP--glucose-1-phosphate uridylyltransferase